MLEKAKRYLVDLGLKENESQVYLACLQKPMGLFVHEIVNITSLKRSTIDLVLNRMISQNFISRYKQGARWVYCAESPDKISYSAQVKIEEFTNFIPALLNLVDQGHTPHVRFYEGSKGVESIYEDILLTNKAIMKQGHELLIISSGKDLIRLLPNHYKQFVQKRIRNGIPIRVLAPNNPVSQKLYKTSQAQLRTTCFFDEQAYPFKTEIDIYGNKIALINFTEPGIMGTVIESAAIASSMQSVFNMLWVGNRSS